MKLLFKTSLFLIMAAGSIATAFAAYEEGKHYQKLASEITDSESAKELEAKERDKVIVLEFFSYGCSWCYKIDPLIEEYQKKLPSDVAFVQIPVEFQPSWAPLTKAFYTAQALKAFKAVHEPLFEAVQTEKITSATPEVLRKFFASKGVKKEDFDKTFESFAIQNQQKWANEMTRAYKITAIPAIIVQGPKGAFMTSVRMAGTEQDVIHVVDELVKMQTTTESPKKKK